MPIHVMIVDDHPVVIEGLCNILRETPHISVMATYADGDWLLISLKERQPDVLLLDIQLPGKSGAGVALEVLDLYPDVQILVMSAMDTHTVVKDMIQMGCRGYILKQTADKYTLVEAIEKVYKEELYLDPLLKDELMYDLFRAKKKEKAIQLSRRETEILKLIAEEYSNPEIAEKLYISLRTVENHKYNLFQKLEAKNSVSLVKIAIQRGLLFDR